MSCQNLPKSSVQDPTKLNQGISSAAFSFRSLAGEESIARLTQVVDTGYFLVIIWLGALVFCRLEEVTHTGDPQSLAISSRTLPHGILQYGCSLHQACKESFYFHFIQQRVLYKVPNHKWHSITSAIFYWLDSSERSHPYSRGGDYIKAWTSR